MCHGRRDAQAAADEGAVEVDFDLNMRPGHSVHLLEFINQEAHSTYISRIEAANLCLELSSVLSFEAGGCKGPARKHLHKWTSAFRAL